MAKTYMIPVYGILVKSGGWVIEPTETEGEKVVPEPFRLPVAVFLATQSS